MRAVFNFLYANRCIAEADRLYETLKRWRGYIKPGPFQIGVEMHDEADRRLRQEIEEVLE